MSGDGRNNSGIAPATAREAALARHITVNGLPILDGDYGLGDYYSAFVAGGEDSFVIVADSYKDFAKAFRTKLIRELSPKLASNARPVLGSVLPSLMAGPRAAHPDYVADKTGWPGQARPFGIRWKMLVPLHNPLLS